MDYGAVLSGAVLRFAARAPLARRNTAACVSNGVRRWISSHLTTNSELCATRETRLFNKNKARR